MAAPRIPLWGRALLALLAASSLGVLLLMLAAPYCEPWWRHRLTPQPDGLVMQLELREWLGIFDKIVVMPIERNGPAILIYDEGLPSSRARFPETITVVRYPTGEVLEHVVAPHPSRVAQCRTPSSWDTFDFDGDGTPDRGEADDDGWVHVRSDADGSKLWSQHDDLEYETNDRLIPLGELDGDGCSELAVLHPRDDRSNYDWEPLDALFGAKSWLSIVSGARACGR